MERMRHGLLSSLKQDLQALIQKEPGLSDFARALLLKREFHIMLLYRLSRQAYRFRMPWLATLVQRINIVLFSIEISYKIEIAGGVKINHGIGTVIGDAEIHGGVVIFQNVTIGVNYPEWTHSNKKKGYPVIEENVVIFPGAVIVGPITVGKNSIIGANAVVTRDVLPGSVISVPPATDIAKRDSQFTVTRGAL